MPGPGVLEVSTTELPFRYMYVKSFEVKFRPFSMLQ